VIDFFKPLGVHRVVDGNVKPDQVWVNTIAACDGTDIRRVILTGPPGSGKGSQAPRMVDRFGLKHLSTGDMLRAAVAEGTPLGKEAGPIMKSGGLVSDDLINGIVFETLSKPETACGFILDGYPRTVGQAEALNKFLSSRGERITDLVALNVPDEVLDERITGRRIHKSSGRSYHVKFNPPKVDGKDDVTGEDLIQRKDDTSEALKKRLGKYYDETKPVIGVFEPKGIVRNVNANQAFEKVWGEVLDAMTGQ